MDLLREKSSFWEFHYFLDRRWGCLLWNVRAENVFQFLDGRKLFVSNRLSWSVQVAVLECGCQITDGAGYVVLAIFCWDCKVVREKVNSV